MAQTVCIILGEPDRKRLAAIVSDRNRQRKHVERAQLILASAERGPARQVAARVGIIRPMAAAFCRGGGGRAAARQDAQTWQATDPARDGVAGRGVDLRQAAG